MFNQFQVTIYPGKGQVEPKVYFGSGPTKKDAKFACGSVAWANIEVIRAHSPALSIEYHDQVFLFTGRSGAQR